MATKWRLPSIDVPLTVAALLLVGIGLSIVFSATTVPGQHEGLWAKQLVWFEHSGHEAMNEEPGKFLVSLVRYARPFAEKAGDVAP